MTTGALRCPRLRLAQSACRLRGYARGGRGFAASVEPSAAESFGRPAESSPGFTFDSIGASNKRLGGEGDGEGDSKRQRRKYPSACERAAHADAICKTLDEHASCWGGPRIGVRRARDEVARSRPCRRHRVNGPNAASPVGPIPLSEGLGANLKPVVQAASYSGPPFGARFATPMPSSLRLAPGLPLFIGHDRHHVSAPCRARYLSTDLRL